MSYALIGQIAAGSTSGNGVTTGSLNTTGAHLLVAIVSSYEANAAPTLTDSKSNTWTGLTAQTRSGQTRARIFYCANATVGSGHTFTVTGTSSFPAVWVGAYSESASATYDASHENGTNAGATTSVQPGSLTPSVDNCLVVTGMAMSGTGVFAINSSFLYTQTSNVDSVVNTGGQCFGVEAAYKIQTSAGAENPTWSSGTNWIGVAVVSASFKPAGGGGGGSSIIPITLTQRRRRL